MTAATGWPRRLLRAEAAALAAAGLAGYTSLDAGWWLFAVLVLAPDLSMLGYLAGPRIGALAYNAAHTTVAPLALGIAGAAWTWPLALAVALVWLVHIGVDRMLGYGLKYPDGFGRTHLGHVGRR